MRLRYELERLCLRCYSAFPDIRQSDCYSDFNYSAGLDYSKLDYHRQPFYLHCLWSLERG